MRPISSEVNDLMDSYDASFVIKQPRINWTIRQEYTVEIVEQYKSVPEGKESSVQSTPVIEGCYLHEHGDTDKDAGKVDITC